MVHPQHTLHYPGSYVLEIKVKVRLSLWLHAMCEDEFSKWRNAPLMLCRWRWVVSFCPSCFTATERPQDPLARKQGGPQSWHGRSGEQEKIWPWQNVSPDVPPFSPQCRHYTEWTVPSLITWVTLWKTVSLVTAENIYACLQNCTKQLLVSSGLFVHPSVCPHGTTQFPLDIFSWYLISDNFSKICQENSSLIKI